jgi:amino acid transporter
MNNLILETPFTSKLILASIYSATIYSLFGMWLGYIISTFNKLKSKTNSKFKKKKTSRKFRSKGQVSLELIAIIAVLIIAAVIVGIFYLNSMNKKTSNISEVDLMVVDLESRLGGGFDNVNASGKIVDVDKRVGTCDSASLHCSNGIKDCGELAVDCGGSHCNTCDLLPFEIILNPSDGEYSVNEEFTLGVNILGGNGPYKCIWKCDGVVFYDEDCRAVTKSFSTSGTFNISLKITDDDSSTESDVVEINII